MIFYFITDLAYALVITLTFLIITKIPIKVKIRRKKLITRIEKELASNYNYFRKAQKAKIEGFIEKTIVESGIKMNLHMFYFICFLAAIAGGAIGYMLKFPFLILLLIINFFFIPIFILLMLGSWKNIKSYRTSFKVLHAAEKASQLTNSPLIVFKKILSFLYKRDRIHFEYFIRSFDANRPYYTLFHELEKNINNKFIKELVIYGRETANGINYNRAINLILDGYNTTFELMEKRKRVITYFAYLIYALSIAHVIFSVYITNHYAVQLHESSMAQLFFKITLISVFAGVILSSLALINANKI